ncbi:MAG: WD40 repeat domain-containing protein [Mongoliibacter sp.]|jgi:WD repeat-containing protein 61|uniref:WD40 repeat domain-containing protein n=1 Tax=Mongoliibacter sp. TaxID=2022438 RepID=UPI0012F29433|nr:PQQ-binding-like beta-propeller repeat protein [Mongoliibacter sp.]TVP45500.1 MAG: WD40 repeat domain-containing protein [Mongoliibacter sp.]
MIKIQVNKLHTLTGHNDCIYALVEGPDPRFFYTASGDGMVVEWDMDNPKDGKLMAKVAHSVYALEVDKERNLLFIGHNFEGVHVIDLENSKELWSIKVTDQSIFDIKAVGNELYVGTGDGVIIIIDIENKSVKKHIKVGKKSVRVLSIDPTRRQLAVGLSDNSIKVFNLADHSPIHNLEAHNNSVFALGYAPNKPILVSGGRDAYLNIWDTSAYSLQESIVAHMFAINYLSFREDGKYFVTCSMDKSIKVWDSDNYKLLKVIDKSRYAGHGTSINKVLWSSYNHHIVSVSDDRKISIWELQL